MKNLLFGTILTILCSSILLADTSIYISNNTAPINGSFWSIRDKIFKNIRIRFFRSGKTNKFNLLTFDKNDKYINIGHGTYNIENGRISNFQIIDGNSKISKLFKNKTGSLYEASNDLKDTYYIWLKPGNIKLWNYSKILFGKERTVQDIPIIMVGKSGTTTDNVKIRLKPTIQSKSVKYYSNGKWYNFLPKDTYVYVAARTKKKYKVKNWENYWYLLQIGKCSDYAIDLVDTKFIWAYGEFIKYGLIVPQDGKPYYPKGFPYD